MRKIQKLLIGSVTFAVMLFSGKISNAALIRGSFSGVTDFGSNPVLVDFNGTGLVSGSLLYDSSTFELIDFEATYEGLVNSFISTGPVTLEFDLDSVVEFFKLDFNTPLQPTVLSFVEDSAPPFFDRGLTFERLGFELQVQLTETISPLYFMNEVIVRSDGGTQRRGSSRGSLDFTLEEVSAQDIPEPSTTLAFGFIGGGLFIFNKMLKKTT